MEKWLSFLCTATHYRVQNLICINQPLCGSVPPFLNEWESFKILSGKVKEKRDVQNITSEGIFQNSECIFLIILFKVEICCCNIILSAIPLVLWGCRDGWELESSCWCWWMQSKAPWVPWQRLHPGQLLPASGRGRDQCQYYTHLLNWYRNITK